MGAAPAQPKGPLGYGIMEMLDGLLTPQLRDRVLDVKDLKGRIFLAKVGPDRKGEGYTNILERRHIEQGLPDDAEFVQQVTGGNGSAGPATPAPRRRKKASKKKTKKGKR